MFEGLLASRSVLLSASALPPILCWRSSSEFHLCNLRSSLSLSLYWFSALSSSLFCRFYMQKIKAKTERQSLLVYGFSSLFHFSCAFSLLFSSSVLFFVFSFSPSLVTEMDEDNDIVASAHSRWSLLLGQ